jgi:hypothetical protein
MLRDEGVRVVSDLSNDELVRKYAVKPDGTSSLRVSDTSNRNADDAGIALAEVPPRCGWCRYRALKRSSKSERPTKGLRRLWRGCRIREKGLDTLNSDFFDSFA